jgi:hypothetical protein
MIFYLETFYINFIIAKIKKNKNFSFSHLKYNIKLFNQKAKENTTSKFLLLLFFCYNN